MRWPAHRIGALAGSLSPAAGPDRAWPAIITLFFIAALIPETLATFNSPPLLLATSPYLLPFLGAFYGSVALLVREFLRRRNAGWTAVLLFGMAAVAANEGIIAGTWYRVQYPGYALIGGANLAVAVGLTAFHALVSAVIPICLVEIIFPRIAASPWLGRSGVLVCLVLLAATIATGFGPAGHRGQKLAALCCALVAVAGAVALPASAARPRIVRPAPRLGLLRLAGATATVAFFSILWLVPALIARDRPCRSSPALADRAGDPDGRILRHARRSRAVVDQPHGMGRVADARHHHRRPATRDRAGGRTACRLAYLEPAVTLPALAGLTWLHLRLRRRPAALHPGQRNWAAGRALRRATAAGRPRAQGLEGVRSQ